MCINIKSILTQKNEEVKHFINICATEKGGGMEINMGNIRIKKWIGGKVAAMCRHGFFNLINDKTYLKIMYWGCFGKKLDVDSPSTYNEKLQWLKLYNRNPQYTKMVDKYQVRDFVKERIGEEYLVPLLGMWKKGEDIDFDSLPEQFVLKCNHDTGSIVVCKNKKLFDNKKAVELLNKHLKRGTFYSGREWPYKSVSPCIIAEQYLEDHLTGELRDYKFFTFNGKPVLMFIASDRQNTERQTSFDFFDMEFNHIDLRHGHPNAENTPEKPINFEKMKQLAEKLSEGTKHLRVDFYEVDGKVYFGELTFYHHSGFVQFDPEEWDQILGNEIIL